MVERSALNHAASTAIIQEFFKKSGRRIMPKPYSDRQTDMSGENPTCPARFSNYSAALLAKPPNNLRILSDSLPHSITPNWLIGASGVL